MVTTFDIQNVINQTMKAPCKHRTAHKTLQLYTRRSCIYKFIHINVRNSPYFVKMIYSYCKNCRMIELNQHIISHLHYCH